MKRFTFLMIIAAFLFGTVSAQQEVFTENFDDGGASERWTFSEAGGVNAVDFAFDYVTEGLEEAPNGGGLGMKLTVNTEEDGEASAILTFPTGQSFTGEYTLVFDLYLSYTPGGSGTTEHSLFGVGHTDTDATAPASGSGGADGEAGDGPNFTGLDFGTSPDNGANRDIRVYDEGVEMLGIDAGLADELTHSTEAEASSVYSAAYDGDSPGNQWLEITVDVGETTTTFKVNDVVWAEYPGVPGDGNIMLGYMDFWGSVADAVSYAVYDNVKVLKEGTGIADNKLERISIYPNPVTNVLSIDNISIDSEISIMNLEGKQLHRQNAADSNVEIDLSTYPTGVYLLKVVNDNDVRVEKIVKR